MPKYRGFAPVINSLINGEKKVGVTALYANSDYDKGDIIFQESLKLNYPAKIKNVIKDLIPLYIKLMNKIVYSVKKGKSSRPLQNGGGRKGRGDRETRGGRG